jgi:hypothetical protein
LIAGVEGEFFAHSLRAGFAGSKRCTKPGKSAPLGVQLGAARRLVAREDLRRAFEEVGTDQPMHRWKRQPQCVGERFCDDGVAVDAQPLRWRQSSGDDLVRCKAVLILQQAVSHCLLNITQRQHAAPLGFARLLLKCAD